MIAPTPFFSNRGTHIRIFEEVKALVRRGYTLHIITYHLGENPFHDSNIRVHRVPALLFWYRKTEAGVSWQKIILDILIILQGTWKALRLRPDIIDAHHHEGVLIGWCITRLLFWRSIRLIGDFHSSLADEMASDGYLSWPPLFRFFRWLERMTSRLPDEAIASSTTYTGALQKMRRGRPTHYVPDGVGGARSLDNSDSSAHERFHLPRGKVLIVYAGGFQENKGILTLLDAFGIASRKRSDIHLVLAGSPALSIKAHLASRPEFRETVTLVSPLSYHDVPALLGACDIGVDPKEPLVGQASGKILQYMGAGLPIVCYDTPQNREYLGDGGLIVRERSPEKLAEALLALANDPEKRRQMRKESLSRSRTFSWQHTAETIERIYHDVSRT
ncbi:MAG: glycosyltransferase [Candidatus Kerfeldbacteria bacterium]|nr:glycosyltransferase [Candidatus Kerfeldbacteria bacterium]